MIARRLLSSTFSRYFSVIPKIPVIDAGALIYDRPDKEEHCKAAVESMHKYGVMIVKDPRIDDQKNEDFLDMMENYYDQCSKLYYADGSLPDGRPEAGYQCGVCPELKERAREHTALFKENDHYEKPWTSQPPPKDGKWRFMWRVGNEAEMSLEILPDNVIPENFPEWEETMDGFGDRLLECSKTASEMIALGFGWKQDTLRGMMEGATQLLGPTGSDMTKYTEVGDILAGFHYDLSFLTIHGKSRFPGLYIWLRTGERIPVKVPEGCFLIQAAKQMEILTGGYIYAGFHEVVVDEALLESVEKAKADGKSTWRVSSTMFSSIRYDQILQPLLEFSNEETLKKYPPILTADQVAAELKAIELLEEKSVSS